MHQRGDPQLESQVFGSLSIRHVNLFVTWGSQQYLPHES